LGNLKFEENTLASPGKTGIQEAEFRISDFPAPEFSTLAPE
jgi:hypothetical protein